jgi:hypothetical protein
MLGFVVSERTVSRYMPRKPAQPDAIKRWLTFLQNHREAISAMDFFVVPAATFRLLYVWFAIDHSRRRILQFNVTTEPTAAWVLQQLRETFGHERLPRHFIFDRDSIFSAQVISTVESFGSALRRRGLVPQPVAERRGRALGRKRAPRALGPRCRAQRPPPAEIGY